MPARTQDPLGASRATRRVAPGRQRLMSYPQTASMGLLER